jgi:hypothetical protein
MLKKPILTKTKYKDLFPSPPFPATSQGRRKGNDAGSRVLVSGAMLVEVETVLQTQVLMLLPSIYPPQVIRRLVSFFF